MGFTLSPPDSAVLLLVTVWCCALDCSSLQWISPHKALVPARGSHPSPCLLSHFPDKPKCIKLEPPCQPQSVSCMTPKHVGASCDGPPIFTLLFPVVWSGELIDSNHAYKHKPAIKVHIAQIPNSCESVYRGINSHPALRKWSNGVILRVDSIRYFCFSTLSGANVSLGTLFDPISCLHSE